MLNTVDFTSCPRVAGRAYNGRDRLVPLVAELDFTAILNEMPYPSTLQRKFYRVYLEARREALFNR